MQTDEALFATPLFREPDAGWLHRDIPAMLMSYLGTLKTFLYLPVFAMFGTGVWATRLPMLLAGVATICVFYRIVKNSQGALAASLAALILATDPIFLLTHTFDWGPVALQILLTTGGCYALYRFGPTGRAKWLALGFLCFGLALWNKALFSWILVGLSLGALVYWREIVRHLRLGNLLISLTVFTLGAAPLLVYNARHDLATLSENTHLAPNTLGEKWVQVPAALLGRSLLGYIVHEEDAEAPKPAWAASQWLRDTVGQRRESVFYYVLAGMLLAVPLWWRSRAAWFALVAFLGGWVAMALTEGAGGSAHHVILLWPLPILFASVVLGRMWRALAIAIAVLVIGANLLVLHQYHYQYQRFGATAQWSDALPLLAEELDRWPGKTFYITDWGMLDSLVLAREGRLPLRIVSGELTADAPTAAERQIIDAMLADPNAILVNHTPLNEIFPHVGQHLAEAAAPRGRRVEVQRSIQDSNGRAIFEVSRVVP